AFNQFYEEFKDHQFTLAASLGYSVKADAFRARARNFPSALEASLFKDDVPIAVYDGLINAVREGIPPLLRYYELRRRVPDLDQLQGGCVCGCLHPGPRGGAFHAYLVLR